METQQIGVDISVKALFNASIHYGHINALKNPAMTEFILTTKDDVSVIDLSLTHLALEEVWRFLFEASKKNKRVLFVGTKEVASKLIKKYALECGQYYVNSKWLGGMITNWQTVRSLSKRLDELEKIVSSEDAAANYKKKELVNMVKKVQQLESVIGGVRKMTKRPDIIFVIDINKEKTAVKEAASYGITTIGVADTNTNPAGVNYVIPGNDDSIKSIELYLKVASDAIYQGIKSAMLESGLNITK